MKRIGIVLGIIIITMILIGIFQNNGDNKKIIPLSSYALTMAEVRLASAKNILDGTGIFTEDQCNKLGELAKKFNPSADYMANCKYTSLIDLATPDTADTDVLTLSNKNYTATFTTDKKNENLINYSFSSTKSD